VSLVTLALAKAQSRVTWAAEDTLIQQYIDTAEEYAARFLNRSIYADDDTRIAAIAAATAAHATAITAYNTAITAIEAMDAGEIRDAAQFRADSDLRAARDAVRSAFAGIVINNSITAAVLLLVAGWYANRESIFTETNNAQELPLGVFNLLFPFRAQLGV
jgi:hypothetical protein